MNFVKAETMILAAAVAAIAPSCITDGGSNNKPNIIYIMADDMGYADLSCYGSQYIKTPNIDKLAAEGIKFTQHYAGTSVCAPSRCSLITGMTTGHCQVRGNKQWDPYGQLPLAENTTTIGTLLKSAGYNTALIGKWGLGVEGSSGDPNKSGFDYFYGYYCQVHAHNHFPEFLFENGQKVYTRNKVRWVTDSTHWTKGWGSVATEKVDFSLDLMTEKALRFIEENKHQPFFLYFSPVTPHDNGEAEPGKRHSDVPSFEPYTEMPWTESEKGYAAMVTFFDGSVGKIIEKIKEAGLEKNTIILVTSDNGGDGPGFFHGQGNLPLRGNKRDLYEGGIRVPMVVRWTGKIKPASITTHASAFWDFMPTVCELAGIAAPENIDGISYLPSLLGKSQKEHESLYFEFHEQGGKQAIIKGEWKCIRLNMNRPENLKVELYNLKDDPSEKTNLADQFPEKVSELTELMKQSRTANTYFDFTAN
jgi:arylsulfatase A-like enzyme